MEQPRVYFRCHSRSSWAIGKAIFLGAVNKPVQYLKKQIFQSQHPPKVGINLKAIQTNTWKRELLPGEAIGDKRTDRIQPDTCLLEANAVAQIVVSILDEAINNHQSDHIADARNCLQNVFERLSKADARSFEFPTGYGRKVLERGIELFLKDGVSCSLKHGILLLDSSNSGAQFYVGLLNLVGAFAVTISEYQISEKMFSLLISWHRKTNVTTHLRDLGAAFNNAGCISLIKGDLKQAESNFDASLKNLKSAEKLQWPHGINSSAHKVQRSRNSSLDVMLIAVESNVSRLFLMSRDFGSALAKQELIVESCKAQNSALPIEEVFTVVNNQAVLHTTLTNFEKAEEALEWLKCYCIEMKREECNFLLNFVSLHLCEVLLLSGKSKEAEDVFSLDTLTSAHGTELALMFGGLHINVRTEAIEKMIDVLVLRGKVKFACSLLEKGVNILRKCFGPDHYNVASMLYKQGMILSLLGEFSDSIDILECSVAILEEMFGTKHPLLLKVYMSLGDVALTLKREDESFLYFQRAMENIEELYQVSFVSQLSTRYVKMTQNAKHFQERRMHVMKTEGLVIDLVAEYGLAFAVVLSRVVVQRSDGTAKGPVLKKGLSIQCSSAVAIISLKCTRDFLQSGQTFLRQGMTKEAAAFFQQAGEHCAAHQLLKGAPNQCLARLYGILAKKRLESREPLEDGNDLIVCLKELSEISTRTTEDVIPVTSDCQLTLKLVLIFLIRLSIELKVIDVTFEAYELYAKLSHSDTDFMFFHNGGVQFYASRTVIKCNGKTAVQDILVSSTIGLNESDSDCSSPDQQLFRSLACKSNVPTDSFLVTYNSSTLLDIDKLQEMERKISLSVQECFQLRCFEAEKRSATQVLVDLSSKSPCKPYDIVAVGRRIELLSLCLSEEISTDVSCGGQLFEISTAMRQTMTRLTFEDEQTSHFMFCKNALLILEQCNPRNISTVSVERHCLSLTITHPVKARLTLWHKNRCIAQKLQLIQTTRRNDPADWMMPQQAFPEVPGGSYCVADGFLGPTIDHLAKKYRVAFEIDISCIDVPLDDSDASCGQNGFPLDEQQSQETRLNTLSQEYEDNETLRICLNESVLEGLTAVSEISRQLYGGATPEDVDGNFIEVAPEDVATGGFPSFPKSQLQQQSIPSQMTLNSQDETETHNSILEASHSIAVKEDPWTREENSMSKTNDDDKELGRSLFEKDRSSRRSFIAELQENLKRKQSPNDPNFVNPEEAMQNCSDVASDTAQASHVVMSDDSPTHIDLTFSGVETPRFNAEDESKTQGLSDSWSQDKNARAAEDENASRLDRNRDSKRPSTAILKDPEPEMERPSQNSSSLEYVSSLTDEIIPGKQDSEDERHPDDLQKDESSPDPVASCQVAQEEYTQNTNGTGVKNLISKGAVNDPDLCQSEASSSVHNQTQRRQQISLHEVHRSRACNPACVDAKANCQIEGVNDHGQSKRYEDEVRENEPLRRKEFPKILPMTEATLDSRFQFDDVVSDGPSIRTSRRAQSNESHFMPLPNTDVVGRPLGGIGTNIRTEPVNRDPRRGNVDDIYNAPLQNGLQSTERSQFHNKANKKTAILPPPPFCEILGGDVLVDGNTTYTSHDKEDVDCPVKIYQDGGNKLSVNEASSFQFDVARDVVDAPVHLPKVDTKIKNIPSDFGGARPKERSANTIKSTSTSNTGLTQPSTAYQYEATETPGIHLDFWKRHAVNGSTLEAPFQEGFGDHYFSAKGVPCNENLRAPWELFSQPSYHSEGTFFELFGKGDHANIRFSRGDGQSLLGHQKPSLPQNESWHFPPPETDETIAMQSKYYDGQKCARRRNSTQLDSFGSKEKALFNSDYSQSEVLYTEMDSMTNEYHSGAGKIDNGPAQSSAVIASQQSSTEDCTSSLLGSLQHIMAKTVKLIASDKAVEKQPKEQKERQKQKDLEKLGIQEEAREGNEEEHAVRSRVEDSIIQVETRQENEPAPETESQSIPTPVQESPRPVCSHYQRRCLVRFPCCGKFFPCHRCHNESEDCSDDQARAINATHIRCTICYHEQAIDEHSQTCSECKSKMSEYFCPTCKHFTSVDKNPFHCDKCGICRIHRDRSFHCDVCNVCLDKRLQGKHKCRPDSGHDECCICLEDAFSGCQILPCSHKVHKDCAIAMIQNGVRTCPICRHPLFSQPQNNSN